jgi:hypothetical protein
MNAKVQQALSKKFEKALASYGTIPITIPITIPMACPEEGPLFK